MALPGPGVPLSMSQIQTEFGGANPIGLNEYYAGGAYVPAGTTGTYGAVPSSGTISIQNFYGTQKFVPVTRTYTSGTGATETVPTGATSVVVTVTGGGGAGGYNSFTLGGGGGGGSQAIKTIAVTGGNTFTYTVGNAVLGRTTNGFGSAGQASTVSGTVSGGSVSMTAGAGGGGGTNNGGSAGGASGGDTNNAGNNGDDAVDGGTGGASASGAPGGFPPDDGTPPGGGGGASGLDTGELRSGTGARGQISFSYT
jgi:hypothetical protein